MSDEATPRTPYPPATRRRPDPRVLRVRCSARSSRTGQPCRAWAVHGATVCVAHGGRAPQVRAAAERRISEGQVRKQLGIPLDVHPLEALLQAVHEAAGNVEMLRSLVADEANTTPLYDAYGKPHTHPVLAFYNEERDRLARFSKLALDAGVDERRVRLAEAMGRSMAKVIEVAAEAAATGGRDAGIQAAAAEMRRLGAGA